MVELRDKKYLLFDLDGTVIDSFPGISKSLAFSLERFGIESADTDFFRNFIGPPLKNSFKKYYGFSEEKASLALSYYREYYNDTGVYDCRLYDGIDETLKSLCEAGKTLILATSKAALYASRILCHFGVMKYFTYVSGSGIDGKDAEKRDVIAKVFDALNIADRENALMIGDRIYDAEGAKAENIDFLAVAYGYGALSEFSGAIGIAETPSDIKNVLLPLF